MRTLSEIYDAIALEKANMEDLDDWYISQSNPNSVLDDHQTLLQDLTSASIVAIWRLIMRVMAVAIWIHEGLWYVFKAEVEELIESEKPHTLIWYQGESFKWQYGDELEWIDGRYQYETYDENKQIIKRAATKEGNGIVAIKVAKESGGVPEKLITAEKTAFEAFWAKYKDAGVFLNIISDDPDLMKCEYDIYYDPFVLADDGSLIDDSSSFPVEDAINNYLSNLQFDGKVRLSDMEDAIQSAEGVFDFERISVQTKYGLNSYEGVDVSVETYAGYIKIDPAFPLSSQLNYIANV